jgi:hypothetical protein
MGNQSEIRAKAEFFYRKDLSNALKRLSLHRFRKMAG